MESQRYFSAERVLSTVNFWRIPTVIQQVRVWFVKVVLESVVYDCPKVMNTTYSSNVFELINWNFFFVENVVKIAYTGVP